MNDIGEKALRDVGKQIIALRNEQDISLRNLEKLTGIANTNLSRIENGRRNSSVLVLARIADALGCHLEFRRGKLK